MLLNLTEIMSVITSSGGLSLPLDSCSIPPSPNTRPVYPWERSAEGTEYGFHILS